MGPGSARWQARCKIRREQGHQLLHKRASHLSSFRLHNRIYTAALGARSQDWGRDLNVLEPFVIIRFCRTLYDLCSSSFTNAQVHQCGNWSHIGAVSSVDKSL